MRPAKFGVGQSIRRVEDAAPDHRAGATPTITSRTASPTRSSCAARTPMPRFAIGDLGDRPRDAGRAPRPDPCGCRRISARCPASAPCGTADGSRMTRRHTRCSCEDTVRHVGDAVAFVVAETEAAGARGRGGARDRLGAARRGGRNRGAEEAGSGARLAGHRGQLAFDTEVGDREKTDSSLRRRDAARALDGRQQPRL